MQRLFWQARLGPGSAPDDTAIHHSGCTLFAVLNCQSVACLPLHPPDKHTFAVQTGRPPVWHHIDYLTPGAQTCVITNRLLTPHKRWLGTAHIGSNSSLIIAHTSLFIFYAVATSYATQVVVCTGICSVLAPRNLISLIKTPGFWRKRDHYWKSAHVVHMRLGALMKLNGWACKSSYRIKFCAKQINKEKPDTWHYLYSIWSMCKLVHKLLMHMVA